MMSSAFWGDLSPRLRAETIKNSRGIYAIDVTARQLNNQKPVALSLPEIYPTALKKFHHIELIELDSAVNLKASSDKAILCEY